jgi:Spy/CpxP family protein refolding chaperone
MKTTTFLAPILVATGLFCASAFPSAAQAPGGGMGGMLTPDQRTKMREAMQASQTELTQLNEKLAAAQKEALTAALAKDASEKTVRAKVEAVAKIQTDISMLRFKGLKDIASTITDEQKTQMQERPGMGYNMLLGGFGGMGGRGGAGGRGGGGGGGGRGGNQ